MRWANLWRGCFTTGLEYVHDAAGAHWRYWDGFFSGLGLGVRNGGCELTGKGKRLAARGKHGPKKKPST